jgi:hypothetical protein
VLNAQMDKATSNISASAGPGAGLRMARDGRVYSVRIVTHEESFSGHPVIINPKFFEDLRARDIISIYPNSEYKLDGENSVVGLKHSDSGEMDGETSARYKNRDVFHYKVLSLEPIKGNLEISILSSIAKEFHITDRQQVFVKAVADMDSVALTHVEISFKNQYIGRADLWRIAKVLQSRCVYVNQSTSLYGQVLLIDRLAASQGTESQEEKDAQTNTFNVRSGLITPNTKVNFRSRSARLYLLLQMSQEMWDYADDGELYFEKCIGFLRVLFQEWQMFKASHALHIVLFSRTFLLPSRSSSASESSDKVEELYVAEDIFGRKYQDHYKVVINVESFTSVDMGKILVLLKEEFNRYHSTMHWDRPRNKFKRIPSAACEGNLIEAINLTATDFERHYIDRPLDKTGQNMCVISAGQALYLVDRKFSDLTKQKMLDNGIGLDLICMSKPPCHKVPLFMFYDHFTCGTTQPHPAPATSFGRKRLKSPPPQEQASKQADMHSGTNAHAVPFVIPEHWIAPFFFDYQSLNNVRFSAPPPSTQLLSSMPPDQKALAHGDDDYLTTSASVLFGPEMNSVLGNADLARTSERAQLGDAHSTHDYLPSCLIPFDNDSVVPKSSDTFDLYDSFAFKLDSNRVHSHYSADVLPNPTRKTVPAAFGPNNSRMSRQLRMTSESALQQQHMKQLNLKPTLSLPSGLASRYSQSHAALSSSMKQEAFALPVSPFIAPVAGSFSLPPMLWIDSKTKLHGNVPDVISSILPASASHRISPSKSLKQKHRISGGAATAHSSTGGAVSELGGPLGSSNPFWPRNKTKKQSQNRRRWAHLYGTIHGLNYSILYPNWKSLCSPAFLPLTSDFYPTRKVLATKFHVYNHTVNLEVGFNDYRDDLELLLREMCVQRQAQDYQLVINNKLIDRSFRGRENKSAHFAMTNQFHRVEFDALEGEITVQRHVSRALTDVTRAKMEVIKHQFLVWSPTKQTYVLASRDIRRTRDLFDWSYVDHLLAGDYDELLDASKYRRVRMCLLPIEEKEPSLKPKKDASYTDVMFEGLQKMLKSLTKGTSGQLGVSLAPPPNTSQQADEKSITSGVVEDEIDLEYERNAASASVRNGIRRKDEQALDTGFSRRAVRMAFHKIPILMYDGKSKESTDGDEEDRFEWIQLRYDTTYHPSYPFHVEVGWLVATGCNIDAWLKNCSRLAKRYRMQVLTIPTSESLSNSPAFVCPLPLPMENHSLRKAACAALVQEFNFVLVYHTKSYRKQYMHRHAYATVRVRSSGLVWIPNHLHSFSEEDRSAAEELYRTFMLRVRALEETINTNDQ